MSIFRNAHWPAWLSELFGTSALLFGTVTAVRWALGNRSPMVISVPGLLARLAVIGAIVGALLGLLIVSPLGRRSGGHLNPAVSVAFWRMGALPRGDVIPYVAAQLLGSVLGATMAFIAWGHAVSRLPVDYAVIQPRQGWGASLILVVEAGSIVLLMAIVAYCLARPGLAPWTPIVTGTIVAVLIAVTGPWTGGSFNPARQFGPALLSGQTAFLWCYLIGPLIGAIVVSGLRRMIPTKPVLTCNLCGIDLRPVDPAMRLSREAPSHES